MPSATFPRGRVLPFFGWARTTPFSLVGGRGWFCATLQDLTHTVHLLLFKFFDLLLKELGILFRRAAGPQSNVYFVSGHLSFFPPNPYSAPLLCIVPVAFVKLFRLQFFSRPRPAREKSWRLLSGPEEFSIPIPQEGTEECYF